MTDYKIDWHTTSTVSSADEAFPCRQVYVWILTRDNQVVIVSKDGEKWQLPGGKPELGETYVQTAIREVREETGLDIATQSDQLCFFGYQTVTELGQGTPPYIQVRLALPLTVVADALVLHVEAEDFEQTSEDIIRAVKTVPLSDLTTYMPWMANSAELTAVKAIR